MDNEWYCAPCMEKYNSQRFWRPNFKPDARVQVEYHFVPETNRRRKADGSKRMELPKTDALRAIPLISQAQQPIQVTTLDVARMPRTKIEAHALRDKHPHPNDIRIRLDDEDNKHDYYVIFDAKSGVEETECIQSTSSVVSQYFPNATCSPLELVLCDNDEFWKHESCQDYFTEAKVQELRDFASRVLVPLHQKNRHRYDQFAFVNSILNSKHWGPTHPKHGGYYSNDTMTLVANLQQMVRDWEHKAHDASTRGTFVHYLIELDMNGQLDVATDPMYNQLPHIQQYLHWKRNFFEPNYEPYRTEMQFFDAEHRRVGTCDLLAVRKQHPPPECTDGVLHLVMFDWKNTVIEETSYYDQVKKCFRMGVGPMRNVQSCSYRKYEVQQADYKMLLESYPNFTYNGHVYPKVQLDECALVCFDESNENNVEVVFKLENAYKSELLEVWNIRKRQVEAWKKKYQKLPTQKKQTQQQPRPDLTQEQCVYLLQHLICKRNLFAPLRQQKQQQQQQKQQQQQQKRAKNAS